MFLIDVFAWRHEDPLWALAALLVLPAMVLEIVFLFLAGIILRASAAKAGKGWILCTLFFVLGIVLECVFTLGSRLLFPLRDRLWINWLLGLMMALILVGIISFTLFHLLLWIDRVRFDRDRRIDAARQKSL